ncbi:hypothetical protein B0T14DRAFT_438148 [Immersiella caudata]|uniref:LysM domain-containing protein n=1 Tax=Immersiella caudata TaxID=314043 RepID=A0AA39WD93_9PEZI|nr:hypothetical protein B0T14DRAFT_438148 [Immersiella caudata]
MLLLYLSAVAGVVLGQSMSPPGPTHAGVATNCNKWVVAKKGDNCATVENQAKITHAQFLSWNPAVSNDCITNFWVDYAYCVGVGASVSTTGRTSTQRTTTSPATPVTSIPGPTFTGTPPNCNAWHLVKQGEDCSTITKLYGLSMADFRKLNPAVSSDCSTNFWVGYAYCIRLGPAILTSTGSTTTTTTTTTTKPTSASYSFNSTYSVRHPITSWIITTPTINASWPPTQTQAGQPRYCNNWHLVTGPETCSDIAFQYKIWMTLSDFFAWNPAIGTDCSGLVQFSWVCVGIQPQVGMTIALAPTGVANGTVSLPPYISYTPSPLPTVNTNFSPTPSHGPMPTNCVVFEKAASPGGSPACNSMVANHPEVSQDRFFLWNPVLNQNCAAVREGNYYCLGAYSETDQAGFPQPQAVKTKPVRNVAPDTATNCVAWYLAAEGQTCKEFAMIFGTVGGDCSKIDAGNWYCVAVPGTPTTRTVKGVPSTIPFDNSSTAKPTRCRRFYYVQQGDGCWQITKDAGISLDDFYKWNPNTAPDCAGMWSNIYVCVGLTGPVATFSGSPPKPT